MTVTWAAFAEAAPELAAAGRELLFHPGVGFGYLATVRSDGSPQVHPVLALIAGGRLEVFVVPSPKLDDLRRDGRYALHSAQDEQVNDEFCVEGRAEIVEADERRAAALAAHPASVGDDHVLVELRIAHALLAQYASPPAWPPTYRRWSVDG